MNESQVPEKSYLADTDVQLMLSFQKGDKASFESLMRKYYPRVLNFVFRFLGERALAEDITQEVFIKCYQSAARYNPQAKFHTWLYTIAKNLSLNALRNNKHIAFSLDETFDEGEDPKTQLADPEVIHPAQKMIGEERARIVREAVDGLPAAQKMAVILLRYENFSYEEIAKTMETSVPAVKSLLSRAKEALKIKLSHVIDNE